MRRKTNQNVLISAAAKGSIWTRLSFLVMGTGCVRYKQYVRGLIYFLTEIGFFYFLSHLHEVSLHLIAKSILIQKSCPPTPQTLNI